MRLALILPLAALAALLPLSASAASLTLDPSSATYGPGDTFIVSVRLDPQGKCVNAASVDISYPPSELRVVDVSKGNSILSLWVQNPKVDSGTGRISFAGGIPAGYCGRIPGDPTDSNVLGEVIFTVLKTDAKSAHVAILPSSAVYLNDGKGTQASLTETDATYALQATPTQSSNPWVTQLKDDKTPPEPFTVHVESTKGVFGGAYYAVFSTVDKQSGVDHYEIYENGAWRRVTSPHVLADQSLTKPVLVKAVDKAGNERLGTYNASTTPKRVGSSDTSLIAILGLLAILGALLGIRWLWERRAEKRQPTP